MRLEGTAHDYAAALFEVAREHGTETAVLQDLAAAAKSLEQYPRLLSFFRSPAVTTDEKTAVASRIFLTVTPLAAHFVDLSVRRKVIGHLPQMVRHYRSMLDKHQGLERVSVSSAAPLTKTQQHEVVRTLSALLSRKAVAEFAVDAGLVAGMVVRYGDRVLDGSVRRQLELLEKSLVEEL